MTQFKENAQADRRMEGQTEDRQGQTDPIS